MVAAVAWMLAADAVREQRVLVPMIAYGCLLAVLFGGNPGPPPALWAVSALVLYPIAAWLTLAVAHNEDPVQRSVTVAAAGGWGRVTAATLVVALAGDVVLAAVAVLLPVLTTRYAYPPAVLGLGAAAHLACAATGTAVGLLCARPLIQRVGWSLVVGLVVMIVTGLRPWLPPVGTTVEALVTDPGPAVVRDAALALLVAAAAATISALVARRR